MLVGRSILARLQPAGRTLAVCAAIVLSGILGAGGRFAAPQAGPHVAPKPAAQTPALESASALAAQPHWAETYGKLPLSFEANRGQTGPNVKFISRGAGYSLFLEPNQSVLRLHGSASHAAPVLRMRLEGANPSPTVSGVDELPGKSNYFIGNDPAKWLTAVPHYSKVKYGSAYPGVDLVYYGNQRQLEYDFVVAPGADPRSITLALTADEFAQGPARTTRIAANGDLQIKVGGEELRFHKPVVYQESLAPDANDRLAAATVDRKSVEGRWVLKGRNRVGFDVGNYDPSKTLVIDPVVSFSEYLGGNNLDVGNGVVVDSAGNAYVTGRTASLNYPTTAGSYQPRSAGESDAFVTKLNPSGTALLYSTFIGGKAGDVAFAIALDPATGNVFVTGSTNSTNFPVTSGAYQTSCGGGCTGKGGSTVFVTALNSTGSALLYSTYLGGASADVAIAFGIALDTAGEAYVTGRTSSVAFPTTPGAFQTTFAGKQNAFVSKLNATGTALVYSTYLGGSGVDLAIGIKVDAAGSAYVGGNTASANFPTTPGAFQTACAAACSSADAFVTKLTPDGTGLVYSTFLGGSGSDDGTAMAIDSAGDAYLAGFTCSTDFPTTASAYQRVYGGAVCANTGGDAFVTEIDPSGSALVYSTYIGGSANDAAFGIGVDQNGNAWVSGSTNSKNFPTTPGAFQTALLGTGDVFVSELNTSGSALLYSTYLGGSGTEASYALTVDASGNPYVTGKTTSTDFPVTPGVFEPGYGGGTSDAFIIKFAPGEQVWPLSLNFGSHAIGTTSLPLTTVLSNSDSSILNITSISITGPNSSDFNQTNTCGSSLAPGANCSIAVTFTPTAARASTATLTIADSAPNSPQTVSLTGIGTANSMTLNPPALTFATQVVGTTSTAQNSTLSNTGSSTVNIASIVASGPFTQTNTCGASLAPAASCTISVSFQPTGSGTQSGAVTITDDAGNSPQTLILMGTGTVMSMTPSSLNFGTQKLKTSSAPQNLTLTNVGTATVTISRISITGSRVTSFSQTNTCATTLAAGANCTITVTFTPQLRGPLSAAVTVIDTGGGSPQNAPLAGIGQ